MNFTDLPLPVKGVCEAFAGRLKEILGTKLYGIYMHGAAVFPDSGPIQDIDCHVILKARLSEWERANIDELFKDLSKRFPPLGGELDAFFILFDDARKTSPPQNQLRPIRDESWALHCTHIRAGRYLTLFGPEPAEIFPLASWQDISAALDYEIHYIETNLKYPAYCVLNLCRIIYSFQKRDVVVSKRFSGTWARARYPEWAYLIGAASRYYEHASEPDDERYLQAEIRSFLSFSLERIQETRRKSA